MKRLLYVLAVALLGGVLLGIGYGPGGSGPGSGVGNVAGVVNGVGTEDTLNYWSTHTLAELVEPQLIRRHIYVDAYTGDDTLDGLTPATALRTIALAKKLGDQTYTAIHLTRDQVWSSNTYPITTAVGEFTIGETVSDATATWTARVVDWYRAGATTGTLVLDDLTSTASGAETLTGATSGATGATNSANVVNSIANISWNLTTVTGTFVRGETVTTGGGFSGTVLFWDTDYVRIMLEPTAGTLGAAEVLTGGTSGAVGTTTGSVLREGDAPLRARAEAANADRIVMLVTTDAPLDRESEWPMVHCNGGEVGNTYATDVWLASEFSVAASGCVGFDRMRVEDCNGDNYSQQAATGCMVAMHTRSKEVRNTAPDTSNNCYTTHNTTGRGIIIGFDGCEGFPRDTNGAGQPLAWSTGSDVFLALGTAYSQLDATTGGTTGVMSSDGASLTAIDVSVECEQTGLGWCRGITLSAGSFSSERYLARVYARPGALISGTGPAALYVGNALASSTHSLWARQITLAGRVGIFLDTAQAAPAVQSLDIAGFAMDAALDDVIRNPQTTGDLWSVSITGTWDDSDSGGSPFVIDNVAYATAAAAAAAAPASWTNIFESGSTEITSSGIWTRPSEDDRSCRYGSECWEAYDAEYVVGLPPGLRAGKFPIDLTGGAVLTGIRLGGTGGHHGAR